MQDSQLQSPLSHVHKASQLTSYPRATISTWKVWQIWLSVATKTQEDCAHSPTYGTWGLASSSQKFWAQVWGPPGIVHRILRPSMHLHRSPQEAPVAFWRKPLLDLSSRVTWVTCLLWISDVPASVGKDTLFNRHFDCMAYKFENNHNKKEAITELNPEQMPSSLLHPRTSLSQCSLLINVIFWFCKAQNFQPSDRRDLILWEKTSI